MRHPVEDDPAILVLESPGPMPWPRHAICKRAEGMSVDVIAARTVVARERPSCADVADVGTFWRCGNFGTCFTDEPKIGRGGALTLNRRITGGAWPRFVMLRFVPVNLPKRESSVPTPVVRPPRRSPCASQARHPATQLAFFRRLPLE
jgi:hypothetical protein